jgi:hypothetical protein
MDLNVNRRFRIILKAFVDGAMLEGMVVEKELRNKVI